MSLIRHTPYGWNPRFLAYCTTLGVCPDRTEALSNFEYIVWINGQWKDWKTEHDRWRTPLTDADHAAFDVWLWMRVRGGRQTNLQETNE